MSNKLKRKSAHHNPPATPLDSIDLSRVSSAIRRLATAASGNLGSDCYVHAVIAQSILTRLSIKSSIVAGYSAFRIGDGDSDVILHAPVPGMPPQPGAVAFHVWLESYGKIIDFTTYTLKRKAEQLDELDGGHTTVKWCPDYLAVSRKAISPLNDVVMLHAGLFFYQRVPKLEAAILAVASPLDDDDAATAWMLYQNPELQVFGPNNIP